MVVPLQQKLQRLFNLRDGEKSRLIPLLVLMFTTLTNLLLLKPTANGLFLANLGSDALPSAFILVAIVAAGTTILFSVLSNRISLVVLIQLTQLFSILLVSSFVFIDYIGKTSTAFLYILYVWSNLFGVIAVSQIYLLAGELFDIREAKRLFVWVGVAAISGGVFGGYLTSILASFLSTNFILVISLLLSFLIILTCLPLKGQIEKPQTEGPKNLESFLSEFWYPFLNFGQSRYLYLVASMIALGVMVAKLVEFQYSSLALSAYPDEEELAAFFGFWLSTISLVSLGIQLLLTKYLLKVAGVNKSLQLLPGLLLFVCIVILFLPVLWVVILARLVDGSIKQSLHKSAFELLLLPLPKEEKKISKTFIDIFVDSAATGVSGIILLFLVIPKALPTQAVAGLSIVLLICWLWVVRLLGTAYLDVFRLQLSQVGKNKPLSDIDFSQRKVLKGLAKVLRKGEGKQLLFVLDKLRQVVPLPYFEQPLLILLSHQDSKVRAATVACLANYPSVDIEDKVREFLLRDPSTDVKIQSLFYLNERVPQNRLEDLLVYSNTEDQSLSDAVLIALLAETRGNLVVWKKLKMGLRLRELLRETDQLPPGEERSKRQLFALKAIRTARKKNQYHYLQNWLEGASNEVKTDIFLSIKQLTPPSFMPFLWEQLNDKNRKLALDALTAYDEGKLLHFFDKQKTGDFYSTFRLIPGILRKKPSPKVIKYLFELLGFPDQVVRDEVLLALYEIQSNNSGVQFDKNKIRWHLMDETTLFSRMLALLYAQLEHLIQDDAKAHEARLALVDILEKRLDRNIERIFLLLGLRFKSADFIKIYHALKSDEADRRTNALEFLENLLTPTLRHLILPIAEVTVLDFSKKEGMKKLNINPPDEEQCYRDIINLSDHRLTISLLYLLRASRATKYIDLVSIQRSSKHPVVRSYAQETLLILEAAS